MKYGLFIFFLFFSFLGFSQNLKILDQETGKIIKNVTIFNENQTISTVSNNNGIANISKFSAKDALIFSHISYAFFETTKSSLKANKYVVFLTKESEQLDEVVLSVFKNKEKTNRIAEQIAVISRAEIQKVSPQTSADVLATVPGIKVQKSQFGGGSPVLRGMESNRVLLVVDGIRMNNAIYRKGHLQNSITVSPNLLDRTEVVFGPSSVIYGSDALGGVIHYYTKKPKLSEDNEVKSGLFSRFSTVNQEITNNLTAELRFKNWASLTSVSYSTFGDLKMGKNRSHGFDDWGKVFFYSDNFNGNYNENPTVNTTPNLQKNTGFSQTDILQKFFVPLSKKTDFNVNIQYSTSSDIPRFDKLTELTDINNKSTLKFSEWFYGPQQRLLISPQLEINPEKKWLNKGTITLAYQNIKESRINRKFGNLNRNHREETVNIYSLNGDFSVPVASNKKRTLSYGFELAYNDVTSNSYGRTLDIQNNQIVGFSDNFTVQSRYPDGGSSYTSAAIYADYRQDISKISTLNTGVRLTNTSLSAKWVDDTFITLPDNDIRLQNTALTATIGYVCKPNKEWQLNAVLSSGFRSPNIDDVGKVGEKNGNVTVPNINLKPEHAYNAEVGIQKYFNNKRFRVGANVYYTLLSDYIFRDNFTLDGNSTILYDGEVGTMVANQNRGNAYVTGFTASYQGRISKHWKTSGSITYTKGETYDTNEPLSSIPPLFGNFDVNFKDKKFEAGANLRFNARKKITDYNFTEGIDNVQQTPIIDANATEDINKYYGSPSWMTVGVNGKYVINQNFSLMARLDNIFDQHYKEFASGLSAPGRNLSLSFVANF